MTPHGTTTRYKHYGCRCDKCRAAGTTAQRAWIAKVAELPIPDYAPHGSLSTYNNYSCRCDECRAAMARREKARRAARKAAQ